MSTISKEELPMQIVHEMGAYASNIPFVFTLIYNSHYLSFDNRIENIISSINFNFIANMLFESFMKFIKDGNYTFVSSCPYFIQFTYKQNKINKTYIIGITAGRIALRLSNFQFCGSECTAIYVKMQTNYELKDWWGYFDELEDLLFFPKDKEILRFSNPDNWSNPFDIVENSPEYKIHMMCKEFNKKDIVINFREEKKKAIIQYDLVMRNNNLHYSTIL
jgi:hypothetical protein